MRFYYIYILSNKIRTTYYIGVTNNLARRIEEHKNNIGSIFTKKYNVKDLLYYEVFTSIHTAIKREKQLKKWNRVWKLELIKKENPKLLSLNINI